MNNNNSSHCLGVRIIIGQQSGIISEWRIVFVQFVNQVDGKLLAANTESDSIQLFEIYSNRLFEQFSGQQLMNELIE